MKIKIYMMVMVIAVQTCVMTQADSYKHYFLDHHQGPIVTALGTAYTAGTGLDESIYTNPAALGTLTGLQASTYSLSVIDASLIGAHVVYPRLIGPYSVGVGYKGFTLDGFAGSDVVNGIVVPTTGAASYKAMTYSVALSRELTQKFSLGWTGSYYDERLFSRTQSSMSSQIGMMYQDFFHTNVGLSIDQIMSSSDNWGSENHTYKTKPNIKIGASYAGFNQLVIYGDYNSDEDKISVGLARQVYDFLEIYVGHQFNENNVFGCGFSLRVYDMKMSMSYNPYTRDIEDQVVKVAFRFLQGREKKYIKKVTKKAPKPLKRITTLEPSKPESLLAETRMEVLNGSGVPNVQNKKAELFKKEKLRVIRVSKAGNSNYKESKLIDWRGNPEKANALATLFHIAKENIVTYDRTDTNMEFTLVVGHDWVNSN